MEIVSFARKALANVVLATLLIPGVGAASAVFTNVPEVEDENYLVVYEMDLPAEGGFRDQESLTYAADHSASVGDFDRVAYYLELADGSGTRWVYVSMEAFTADVQELRIPHNVENPVIHQRQVRNMNVYSNVDGIVTGTFIDTGNIEMWPGGSWPTEDFGPDDPPHPHYGVFGASDAVLDWGDALGVAEAGHGSFQVHNALSRQTLLAFNGWGNDHGAPTDVGIGSRSEGHPDWHYAANAPDYTERRLLILVRPRTHAVTFTELPRDRQLFPRDPFTNMAEVRIAGRESHGGFDRAILRVEREGQLFREDPVDLVYDGGEASFAFSVEIEAELAEYDFELWLEKDGAAKRVERVAGIVAGDVFLFYGQSNAEAKTWDSSRSANDYESEWLRTFGQNSTYASKTQNILYWVEAEGDGGREGPGAIGQWAMVLGRELIDAYQIPVAILNGAMGGYRMSRLQKDRNNPDRLHDTRGTRRPYNRLLYRARQAGVAEQARAIFFYQGEADNNDAESHAAGYARLREDWSVDYPGIERFYLVQVRPGCGAVTREDPALREVQRQFADLYPNTSVMASNGLPNHDGCHFGFGGGYEELGLFHFRKVARDLYGAADGPEIDALNPDFVEFHQGSRTALRLVLRNAGATINFPEAAMADFAIKGSEAKVIGREVDDHAIILQLDQPVPDASVLEYWGHRRNGEWVINGSGVGMLSFSLPLNPPEHPVAGEPLLLVENDSPRADGVDAALITFQLLDEAGEILPLAGIEVHFSTTLGVFEDGEASSIGWTDAEGKIVVSLTSTVAGEAEVQAEAAVTGAGAAVFATSVLFLPNAPEGSQFFVEVEEAQADGLHAGLPFTLSVTLLNEEGVPAPASAALGLNVFVETGEGDLFGNTTATMEAGAATAEVAGVILPAAGEFVLRLEGRSEGEILNVGYSEVLVAYPVAVALRANTTSDRRAGAAETLRVEAKVRAAGGSPREGDPLHGVSVLFSSEGAGEFEGSTTGVTDAEGVASVRFRTSNAWGAEVTLEAQTEGNAATHATFTLTVADMARFLFDFGEDEVGSMPAYISLPWKQAEVEVVESEWAGNGRALRVAPYGRRNADNAFFAAVFNEIPAARDVEVLMRMHDTDVMSSLHWMTGAGARINGGPGNETAVMTQSRDGETGLVVARVNGGAFASGFFHFQYPKVKYMRTRWMGDVVYVKVWDGSLADEPEEWMVEAHALPNATMAPGSVGITRFFSQHQTEVDVFEVTLLDSAPPSAVGFQNWRRAHFPPEHWGDDSISGPFATSGGVAHLLLYAFGLDPSVAGSEPIPVDVSLPQEGPALLEMDFTRPVGLTDVIYRPEASDDLNTWTPLPPEQILSVEPAGNGKERVRVRDLPSAEGATARFFRVRVEMAGEAP